MSPIEQFRKLIDAWCVATGDNHGGLSARMFNRDGSRLARVMGGADLTSTTLWHAQRFLSNNWPADTPWPEGIERPAPSEAVDA